MMGSDYKGLGTWTSGCLPSCLGEVLVVLPGDAPLWLNALDGGVLNVIEAQALLDLGPVHTHTDLDRTHPSQGGSRVTHDLCHGPPAGNTHAHAHTHTVNVCVSPFITFSIPWIPALPAHPLKLALFISHPPSSSSLILSSLSTVRITVENTWLVISPDLIKAALTPQPYNVTMKPTPFCSTAPLQIDIGKERER